MNKNDVGTCSKGVKVYENDVKGEEGRGVREREREGDRERKRGRDGKHLSMSDYGTCSTESKVL